MQTLTLMPTPPEPVLRCRPPRVYAAGLRRRDLEVLSIEWLPAPDFCRARLRVHPPGSRSEDARFEWPGALPPVGCPITIHPGDGDAGVLPGVVTAHEAVSAERGEQLIAHVSHVLAERLAAPAGGRWQVGPDGVPLTVAGARTAFNGDGGWASADLHELDGRPARLFAACPNARRWTVADALGYLLAALVPAEVTVPGREELQERAGGIDLGRVDVSGRSAAAAIVAVAHRGGLTVRAARDGLGIVLYRPGRQGRRVSVRQQPAGEALDRTRSNLWRARLRFRRRPARRGVLALGGPKLHETTVELAPGWNPSDATGRWRDHVRSLAGGGPASRDVLRAWVLNEHGRYGASPWLLPTHDFAALGEDFFLSVPRRLRPCVSTDPAGRSLGIVVEWRPEADAGWRPWPGPVYVSRRECTVRLGGDALPGAYFRAALAGTAGVRVTATIASDARLSAEVPGDANLPREVIDLGAQAGWQAVHETSIFHNAAYGEPAERDDAAVLGALAERHAESLTGAAQAELTLAWVDPTYAVGDLVERVEGRALELPAAPDRRPAVTRVRHEFGKTQTTTLTLEA